MRSDREVVASASTVSLQLVRLRLTGAIVAEGQRRRDCVMQRGTDMRRTSQVGFAVTVIQARSRRASQTMPIRGAARDYIQRRCHRWLGDPWRLIMYLTTPD